MKRFVAGGWLVAGWLMALGATAAEAPPAGGKAAKEEKAVADLAIDKFWVMFEYNTYIAGMPPVCLPTIYFSIANHGVQKPEERQLRIKVQDKKHKIEYYEEGYSVPNVELGWSGQPQSSSFNEYSVMLYAKKFGKPGPTIDLRKANLSYRFDFMFNEAVFHSEEHAITPETIMDDRCVNPPPSEGGEVSTQS